MFVIGLRGRQRGLHKKPPTQARPERVSNPRSQCSVVYVLLLKLALLAQSCLTVQQGSARSSSLDMRRAHRTSEWQGSRPLNVFTSFFGPVCVRVCPCPCAGARVLSFGSSCLLWRLQCCHEPHFVRVSRTYHTEACSPAYFVSGNSD